MRPSEESEIRKNAWTTVCEIALLGYVVVDYAAQGRGIDPLVTLACLGILGLALTRDFLNRRGALFVLSLLLLGASSAAAVFVRQSFVVLVPLFGAQLIEIISPSRTLQVLPALVPLLFLPLPAFPPYCLAASLGLLFYFLIRGNAERARHFLERVESLKSRNDALQLEAQRLRAADRQLQRLAHLEERNEIAQVVHDRVGHALAGSIIQLQASESLLDSEPSRARDGIRKTVDVLRSGMEDIRLTLRSLKPQPEQMGIGRLRALVEEFEAINSIRAHLRTEGSLSEIGADAWSLIEANCREALTNVLKHAKADLVEISVRVMPGLIKAEIRDNGRGSPLIKKGMGLEGMEERCRKLGATLICDGSRGFSVVTLIPRKETRNG